MAKLSAEDFKTRDIYIYYDYEEMFWRYEHISEKYFLRILNGGPEYERPYDNNMVCTVRLYGVEISKEDYYAQKVPLSE